MTANKRDAPDGMEIPEGGTELLDFIVRHLYTAVLSDTLDERGARDRAMRHDLRPVHAQCRFAGWAHTIACADSEEIRANPYELEMEAVDALTADSVAVIGTGRSTHNAPWGELLSTAAVARGSRGAVVDGLVRDVGKIEELGFPVFAAGIKPVDSLGRGMVTGYNEPVECGDVLVHPGDLIVADRDGIVAVPRAMAAEVVRIAFDRATREDHSRAELARGGYLRDVYEKYGVL